LPYDAYISIEIDIHFVHGKVTLGQVRVLHVLLLHQFIEDDQRLVRLLANFRSNLWI
jgi:hypothetical protein